MTQNTILAFSEIDAATITPPAAEERCGSMSHTAFGECCGKQPLQPTYRASATARYLINVLVDSTADVPRSEEAKINLEEKSSRNKEPTNRTSLSYSGKQYHNMLHSLVVVSLHKACTSTVRNERHTNPYPREACFGRGTPYNYLRLSYSLKALWVSPKNGFQGKSAVLSQWEFPWSRSNTETC